MKPHASLILAALLPLSIQAARITDPHIPEKAPQRISEHVYEIQSWPDVGFVVGNNAVLVVDTGLGPTNGAIVARHAQQLAQQFTKGKKLYLVTTHFHPEHASGEDGFPADIVLIRSRAQQDELTSDTLRMEATFRQRPAFAELLPDHIGHRQPDILFDQDYTLDLGGVHARIELVGPAHTKGDQIIWVQEDRTLFTGDMAIHDEEPHMGAGIAASVWISVLDKLAALKPLHVIPDHGEPGGVELIKEQREKMSKPATNP